MKYARRNWRLAAMGLALALAGPFVVRAAEKVEVTVLAIRATTAGNEVSPELKHIAEQLKKSFKHTGYKLLKKDSAAVELGQFWTVDLAGGYKASITPQGKAAQKVQVKVEFTKREGDQDKKVSGGGTFELELGRFQLWGGWSLEGKDVLITAVSVK